MALIAGWNLVSWTGEPTPPGVAISATPAIAALLTWDPITEDFLTHRPQSPALLNNLALLRPGDGIWLFADAPAIWQQPDIAIARRVDLAPGFNLLSWTGPDGVAIATALAGLEGALIVAFTYDPLADRFLIFQPQGPAFINTATTLNHGDGVWVQVNLPVVWEQPSAGFLDR